MARPTLGTHPKFFRLASLVGGRAVARGALELIWDAAYASGEPDIGDSACVEAVADWRGEGGTLTAALVSSGFLDATDGDTFVVHDLEDHAPDYVLKRWEREAKRRAAGDTARSIRQRAAKARWDRTNGIETRDAMQMSAACTTTADNGEHVSRGVLPPAPAPAPAPRNSPPAPARSDEPDTTSKPQPPPPVLWDAFDWSVKFKVEWCAKYGTIAYGQGTADAKATGELVDLLATFDATSRQAAQARAGAMIAEYLADGAPGTVKARHPWLWFVQRFNALRVSAIPAAARGSPASPARKPTPYCEWHLQPKTRGRKSHHPLPTCPECKHIAAGNGRRSGDPESIEALIAAANGPDPCT